MRWRFLLLSLPILIAGSLGLYLWLQGGLGAEDVLVSATVRPAQPTGQVESSPDQAPMSVGPVTSVQETPGFFSFGNAYLDGRSAWLRKLFQNCRRELRSARIPTEAVVEVQVHRAPFTEGPWVDTLGEDLARHRRDTEAQTVESRMFVYLEGVKPGDVLPYLVVSEFLERIPGEGTTEMEQFFLRRDALPPGLETAPPLRADQWLTSARWRRMLALPTALVYLNTAFRDGDALSFVYEAWRNVGDSSHVAVRFASGQYALVPRDGGTLLEVKSFYSGQGIPPFAEGLVVGMTTTFYTKVAGLITHELKTWRAPPEVIARLEELGLR